VDITTNHNTMTARLTPNGPAFLGVRWNGWTLAAVAIFCFLAFFVTQLGLLFAVLFHSHPELLGNPPLLIKDLANPSFFIDLLTAKNLWITSFGSEAVLALTTIGMAQFAFRATPQQLGLGAPPKGRWVVWGIGVGIALIVASSIVEAAIKAAFGPHPQPQALVLAKHHGTLAFLFDLMSVSIAAPVAEEIFFRGFIFGGLVQRMSPALAMVISGALFGAAHFDKWSFLPICVIGAGLAWAYFATRSLWVNVVAHATVNTISLAVAYAFPQFIK
jgi:membrane protease YdiL (CAAX protease family)